MNAVSDGAPRWYFGWNIVAAGALLTLLTVGMRMSIGPFFLPLAQDLGFSRSLLASIVAVGMLVYGLAMPLAAALIRRRGTPFVLLSGTVMVVVATIWTLFARDAVSFLLAFGVLLSVGLAFTGPVAVTPVISAWFERRRGMALLFLSTGSMAGIAVMTPVMSLLIHHFGWQVALASFAVAFTLLAVPMAVFVVRDDAPEHKDLPPGAARGPLRPAPLGHLSVGAAMRTQAFVVVSLGLFCCGFSMNLLGTHGMPMLMDHGFDAGTSSLGIGLIGAVAIGGTMILGRLADRMPRKHLLAAIYLVRGLGFFALLVVGTQFELYAAGVVGGLVWAGSIALSSAILADVYGVRLVGVLYGWSYVGHQVGGMISSWLGGWGFDRWGTHWPAFGTAGALLLAAAGVVIVMLPGRSRPGPSLPVPAR
jgi:MFS family permease